MDDRLSIFDLPIELIFQIFRHLSIDDRLRARQVCRQWQSISLMNIDELQTGSSKGLPNQMIRNSRYQLRREHKLKKLDIFQEILQKSAGSLRSLIIVHDIYNNHLSDVCRLMQMLMRNCPNLVELIIEDKNSRLCPIAIVDDFFQQFGPQLEKVILNMPNLFRLSMRFLNPDRLLELGIEVKSQSQCQQLFQKFPLLTSVWCHLSTLDVHSLNELMNVKKLYLKLDLNRNDAKLTLLANGRTFNQLNTLIIDDYCTIKINFFPINFLRACTCCLRHLKFPIENGQQFRFILNRLSMLKTLKLSFYTDEDYEIDQIHFGKQFQNFCHLQFLTKLGLAFQDFQVPAKNLPHFPPMLSVVLFEFRLSFDPSVDIHIRPWLEHLVRIFPNLEHLVIDFECAINEFVCDNSEVVSVLIDFCPKFVKLKRLNVSENRFTCKRLIDYCEIHRILLNDDDYDFR